METATTLLSLLLVMAFDSSRTVAASRNQQCGDYVQKSLKLSRLLQKESVDLIKTYKASQGEMSELFCKVSVNNVPDPNISGLEPSEKIASIYTHLQEFFPHFEWVYEQQTDLQLPTSPLLSDLRRFTAGSRNLAYLIKPFYQSLFPNVPLPEGGAHNTTSTSEHLPAEGLRLCGAEDLQGAPVKCFQRTEESKKPSVQKEDTHQHTLLRMA
ncbi:hypothetical protein CgunFtcFv8_025848 [Champsocephalus gunnari]|uniref:Ciliary neurotrophic factor n=1 Tax=Champsocephalus gunnari TaxID=52237 RepID=A0AAN8CGB0_CHAGU|nr:hypothetical protein CgunFtcFv8_025848 [Champsocephalus gunnari]